MPEFRLLPHPACPSAAVRGITVEAERPARERLALRYRIEGDLDAVRWPAPAAARFAHGLWQTTCGEAFVAGAGERYRELNLSPSSRYAAYDFERNREHSDDVVEQDVTVRWERVTGVLTAQAVLPSLADETIWRIGLTMVIEEASGTKSYWALAHPAPEPDFHKAAGWIAELRA